MKADSYIDFRSDTVTKPCKKMLETISLEGIGDDVFGDDEITRNLEKKAANIFGFEKALFVPSGTAGNLISLMAHCQRGDEYLVGESAHMYRFEGGNGAMIGGVQPQPVPFNKFGTIDFELLKSYIKPDDPHFSNTKLLCLENTFNGYPLPSSFINEAVSFAKSNDLLIHMDGARIFNAMVKEKVDSKEYLEGFNSIMFCLSKGLGAPIGSMICGTNEFVFKARRLRKALGGGMRQTGIVASQGIYALDHNIERLKEDHDLTRYMAENLVAKVNGIKIDLDYVKTNMIFMTHNKNDSEEFSNKLKERGILIVPGNPIRLVIHKGISKNLVDETVKAISEYFSA